MKVFLFTSVLVGAMLTSCVNEGGGAAEKEVNETEQEVAVEFQNKGHEIVYNMVQKVGNYKTLRSLKDVVYTYSYKTPDGKEDVSTEKYLFNGELSYGSYEKHERTLPDMTGSIEQGYDGKGYWLKNDGKSLHDEAALKQVAFNRPTNFYWFTMMQKMLDPSLNYEHLGEKEINGMQYDIVKVSFNTNDDKPTDIYQLYINQKTSLVDQFLFTVADFGKIEIPFLMQMKYEKVEGLLLPTVRQYKASTWDAEVSDAPWINVKWSNIKFNNGLTKADFAE